MKRNQISDELFALFLSNQTAMQILDLLPRSDLADEALDILMDQAEILEARIQGFSMDEVSLSSFIDDCISIYDSYQQNSSLPKYDN